MLTKEEYQMEEAVKRWNIFFTALFLSLVLGMIFYSESILFLEVLSYTEVAVITLATARLIRLVCYDNITAFLREAFLDITVVKQIEGGAESYERVPSKNSFFRTISKLLNCPWCIGVWVALFILWAYSLFPETYSLWLLLAIAQVASLLQIFANFTGWHAEYRKKKTEELQ